ncbi:MAG TPA: VWA domain-containing protein [Bryobacteraceae bacterium]
MLRNTTSTIHPPLTTCPDKAALEIIVLLLVSVFGYAGQQVQPPPDIDGPTIRVDVNLVVLHATVFDRRGRFVPDLREQDFHVYEDGVLQRITRFEHEDVPITAGLVVDHSGSMRRKLPEVSAAVRTFVQSSNPGDQIFVVNFNETVQLGLPGLTRFTNDPSEVESAVSRAPAGGKTALYDAIVAAFEQLKAGTLEKKVLLVVSDGGDNASTHTLAQTLKLAEQSSAIIYILGIFDEEDPDRNAGVLRHLANSTGGMAFFPHNLNEVSGICERIAREVRNQYMLAYVPGNPTVRGDYRTIRVTANAPHHGKLFVRTRTGYRVSGQKPGETAN